MPAAFDVPRIPRVLVCALEVPCNDVTQVRPAVDQVYRKMHELGSSRVCEVKREVTDDEIIPLCPTGLAR